MKPLAPILVLFACIAIVQVISIYTTTTQIRDVTGMKAELGQLSSTIERYAMKDEANAEMVKINGYYFHEDEYYCVWIKNRDPVNVSRTEAHEYCHHMMHTEQKGHFCGE